MAAREQLRAELAELDRRALLRSRRVVRGAQGPEVEIEGRRLVCLGSNNYLGLTTDPRVRQAARDAIDKFGTSMTGSRLVNGSMRLHNELEARLAAYHGKEAGLVFTTGYQVNIATISASSTPS